MKDRSLRYIGSCLTFCVLLLAANVVLAQENANSGRGIRAGASRPATVADAIEMTRTGDNDYLSSWDKSGNVALFSPNGAKFAFVTQKGDLKRDVNEYSIRVFDTASALTSPSSRIVATLASSSNRPAISQLKWLPDNDTLVFIGEQPGETPQIYRASCSTSRLDKLTNHPTAVVEFSMSDRGDAFTYLAEAKGNPVFSNEQRRRGFVV